MWESSSPRNSKFAPKRNSEILPSTLVTRQRMQLQNSHQSNSNVVADKSITSNRSVLTGAGPLLSTPFMPQIKRALGLEPKSQTKYGDLRRHSFGIRVTPTSPTVASGSLPHVRLTKTRRLSLSEKNSSMLNKSSTVKIAPPVIGKVASPSLYHMRCNSSIQEDRNTPDTYAVISALKERRKRSINAFDDHAEPSMQQAKRRRQESQHSNASTSSMPSMPENFPELTNADFRMRLDTPGLKRPSRPSQEDLEEWDNEGSTKRHLPEVRNNSILSSLSSSQRFIENQMSKRKAETSFHEKENSSYVIKSQRKEPPKLTHLDIPYSAENATKTPTVPVQDKTPQFTNGHSSVTSQKEVDTKKSPLSEASSTPVLPKMPSMKKTASIYSGLGSPASFKKAQYANVVATLDDYDTDKEAEKQRVKQMLKDLDDSFSKKEEKPEILATSTSTLPTTTVSVSSTSAPIFIATAVSTIPLDTSKTLSALEKLSKSPIQETGGVGQTGTSTQPGVSFKPLFGTPSTTQSLGSSAPTGLQTSSVLIASGGAELFSKPIVSAGTQSSSSTPGGFNFNIQKTTESTDKPASTTGGLVTPSLTIASSQPGGFNFGLSTTNASMPIGVSGFAGMSSTAASTTASTATTSAAATIGFGLSSVTSSQAGAPAAAGFSFNITTAPATTTTQSASLFNSQLASSTSAPAGFSFGTLGSAGASTGGVSFGGQTSTPVTTVASSQFGTVTTASTAPAFNFGAGANTGSFGTTAATTSAPASGFSFGTKPATTTVSSVFGTAAAVAAAAAAATTQSPFAAPVSTSQTPFGASTGSSAPTFNFGAAKTTASASPFSFNTGTSASSAGSTPFQTGQSAGSAPATTGLFQFGSSASAPAFGATATQSGSVFGTANQTPAFGSGSQPPAYGTNTTPAFGSTSQTPAFGSASQPPAFGAASQPPAYGTQNQTQTPAFGSTSQPPAFGTQNQTQTPAFGSASQPPAFGTQNQTQTFAFGSTSQPPAFGSAGQPPAFGTQNQTQTPAFGAQNQTSVFSSGNKAPTFGSATPTFGAATNQQTSTPIFGATATNASGSVFGNTGNTGTGFSKSHSTPAFSTNLDNANTGTFNFGGPVPNVNPFGQTTPAKQTGAAFGLTGNDATPKSQTGTMFQFGQTNNNSTTKGFDFSSSATPAGGSGTAGFNFMAANVFNFGATGATPTATPGSTPAAFSAGASVAPRPRPGQRSRTRRGTRK